MDYDTAVWIAGMIFLISAPLHAQNIPGVDNNQAQEEDQRGGEGEKQESLDQFIPGTSEEEEEQEEEGDQKAEQEEQEREPEEETEEPDQQEGEEDEQPDEQLGEQQLEEEVSPGVDWSYVLSSNAKYQEVHGSRQQSTLDENFTAFATHDLKLDRTFEDDSEFGVETSVRTSDDPRADSDPFTVNRLQTRYETDPHKFVAGDYGVSFSNYSLTGSLKGVSYEYKQDDSRLQVLGGTDKPEWKMAVERTRNEPRDRVSQGVRYEHDFLDSNLETGVSLAHSRDNFEGTSVTGPKTENWNTAVDATWDITDSWNASGELAWSSFDRDVDRSGRRSDLAGLFQLDFNREDVSASATYEAVGREFQTTSGSGSAGTRRFLTDGRWDAMEVLTLNGGIAYNDNQLSGTGKSKQAHGGFSIQDIDYFPGWRLEDRLTVRKDEPGRSSTTSRTITNSLTTSNTFMGMRGSFSYDATAVEVHPNGNQGSRTDTFSARGGAPLTFLHRDSSLSLSVSHQIAENRSTGEKDITDRLSSNVRVPLRKRTTMNVRYSLSIRDSGTGQDTTTNRYGFDLEYEFPDPWDAFASLNVDHRDNNFDGASADYAETTVGLNLNLRLQ